MSDMKRRSAAPSPRAAEPVSSMNTPWNFAARNSAKKSATCIGASKVPRMRAPVGPPTAGPGRPKNPERIQRAAPFCHGWSGQFALDGGDGSAWPSGICRRASHPLRGTVAMAKIQSEFIVAIIAAVVAVAVWRVARNPELAVLAIAMLYVVARSVIARAFQE
jgi:hypothetical protein